MIRYRESPADGAARNGSAQVCGQTRSGAGSIVGCLTRGSKKKRSSEWAFAPIDDAAPFGREKSQRLRSRSDRGVAGIKRATDRFRPRSRPRYRLVFPCRGPDFSGRDMRFTITCWRWRSLRVVESARAIERRTWRHWRYLSRRSHDGRSSRQGSRGFDRHWLCTTASDGQP